MASGYESGATDLDSLLAPLHSGWPQASAVGYGVAAVDLNARYAPLSTGGAASATGYKKATADLNTIFAALGSTGVTVGTQPGNVSGTSAAGRPTGVVTSSAATCAGAKGGGTYTYTWHTTGCTATSPSSQSTTFFATVNAASTDSASAFCTISDGVTSVNTTTISVTLQNTTSAGDFLTMVTAVSGNVAGYTFAGFGSMTPTNLGDGARVDSLLLSSAVATPVPNQMQLFLEGYPGTITGAYIASISINGTFMPMSGADFSFSGGTPGGSAQFAWRNQGGVYSATHGGFSIPVVIVRS